MITKDKTLKLYMMYDSKFTTFIITSSRLFSVVKEAIRLHWIVWTACLFRIDCIDRRIQIDFSKQKQNFSFIFANITLLLVDIMDDISENQTISQKGERRQEYSMEFKKATIKYAQENSTHSAAKKFKGDRKRVREWIQKEKDSDLTLVGGILQVLS